MNYARQALLASGSLDCEVECIDFLCMLAVCAASDSQRCKAVTEGDEGEDAIGGDLRVGVPTPRNSRRKRALSRVTTRPYSRVKDAGADKNFSAISYAQGAQTGLYSYNDIYNVSKHARQFTLDTLLL